jgi:ketosteroid isomerase-like protein
MTRWLKMIQSGDFSHAAEVLDEDVVAEWPQSRERVRGLKNLIAIMGHYPGGKLGTHLESAQFMETPQDRYLMTPMFTTVKATGSGNKATGIVLTRYPDGSDWYIVMTAETKNGKIVRNDAYFAPLYDAPAWRAKWVERMGDDE